MTAAVDVVIRTQESGSGPSCRAILDRLPKWFGFPETNDQFVADTDSTPCILASVNGEDVGIVHLVRHTPYAAELNLIAVVPELHRHGIGRMLLQRGEEQLRADGVEFLQVKTLSDTREDEGYAKTRAFYLSYGFRPLQEFPDLWNPDNPALQLIKTVG